MSAFTLIEILVVVMIIAILTTITLGAAKYSNNSLRKKQAISTVTGTLARARQQANEEIALRITTGLPANFTTLQMELRTARLSSFRP